MPFSMVGFVWNSLEKWTDAAFAEVFVNSGGDVKESGQSNVS